MLCPVCKKQVPSQWGHVFLLAATFTASWAVLFGAAYAISQAVEWLKAVL